MDAILNDLRLALRGLWKSPGFSLIVVITLALGIGANTAIFSVLYGVALRPLPYLDPDALVVIQGEREYPSGMRIMNFSPAEYDDWVEHSRAFSSFGQTGRAGLILATDAGVEPVTAAYVSEHFFATTGPATLLGRSLGLDDAPVAVMSYGLWQRRFGGDPQILGRSIDFSGRQLTIVGVARPDFKLPDSGVDLWTSFAYERTRNPSLFESRNRGGNQFIARLKPGVSLAQAREDVARVITVLEPHFDPSRRGTRPRVTPLAEYVSSISDVGGTRTPLRPVLLTIFAAVGLVLLVACANVTNLMLARYTAHTREVAIRAALGAGRTRLIRQSLADSLVVATAGAAAGVALASGAIALLKWMQPAQVPRLADVQLDGPVFAFAAIAALLTVVLSGLVPAFHGSRPDLVHVLRANTRTQAGSRGARRVRAALVVSELAIAIVLLVGATLLGRSLLGLLRTDLGVNTDGVLTSQINLALGRTLPEERSLEVAETLVQRLRALPGVEAAGVGSGLPPNALWMRNSFELANPTTGQRETHMVSAVPATPEYFSVLRIALVKGRLFDSRDGRGAPKVVIVTDDAARRFFGDRDPIGQTLPIDYSGDTPGPVPVVGVVKNVKYSGIDAPVEGVIYRPFAQAPFYVQFLVARTTGDPTALAAAVRAMIREVDPQINIMNLRMLDQAVYESVAQPRFRTALLSSIAGLALLLAAIGLSSVIAYSVSQRTMEIGVRVALGARRWDVFRLVLGEAALLLGVGVGAGTAAAYVLSRTLRAFLYGVAPTDPVSFAAAGAVLVAVGLAATYLPARRATRVDPVVALRAE